MGHICQKPCFGRVGSLGILLGTLDLSILPPDHRTRKYSPNDKSGYQGYKHEQQQPYQRMFKRLRLFYHAVFLTQKLALTRTVKHPEMKHMISVIKPCILKRLKLASCRCKAFILFIVQIYLHLRI